MEATTENIIVETTTDDYTFEGVPMDTVKHIDDGLEFIDAEGDKHRFYKWNMIQIIEHPLVHTEY